MSAATATCSLLLGDIDGALRLARSRGLHGGDVRRANAKVVMDVRTENCPAHQRSENVGDQQIGDSFQLISGGQVAGNLHAQIAKVLHRPPNFGARCAKFFRDARAADDHGRVVAQQADDAAEPSVGGVIAIGIDASWGNACDTTIMREAREKRSAAGATQNSRRFSPGSG